MRIDEMSALARQLGLEEIAVELDELLKTATQGRAPILVPLVGEFNSGKTSLCNALTDAHALEVASQPTTATIFELHFSAPKSGAVIHRADGSTQSMDDIGRLRNSELADVPLVEVFDTSRRVPEQTVLVDTPGLSSPAPRHKQALLDFMPRAQAVLLVVDVSQQLTASALDFVRKTRLSGRTIHIVLNKCDQKVDSELREAQEVIQGQLAELHSEVSEGEALPAGRVLCCSAATGDTGALEGLLSEEAQGRAQTLRRLARGRAEELRHELVRHVEEQLAALQRQSAAGQSVDREALARRANDELDDMQRRAERLLQGIQGDIDRQAELVTASFRASARESLCQLVEGTSREEVDSAVNNELANYWSIGLNDFVSRARRAFGERVSQWRRQQSEVAEDLNLQAEAADNFETAASKDLGLHRSGHQWDDAVEGILDLGSQLVLTAASRGMLRGGAQTARLTAKGQRAVQLAKTADRALKMEQFVVNRANQVAQAKKGGLLRPMVEKLTEFLFGRGQRVRDFELLFDQQVAPQFRSDMREAARLVGEEAAALLDDEAQRIGRQLREGLQRLRSDIDEGRATTEQKLKELREAQARLAEPVAPGAA